MIALKQKRFNAHMFFFTILLSCLVCFLNPRNCSAQVPDLKFKHISTEQGLSHSDVDAIFQDSRGFMWFGTRYGLNRYDGVKIIVYKNIPNDDSSISDNTIRTICEDKNHQLWIGTRNGLNRFNQRTNNFTRFKNDPRHNGSISSNFITHICLDKNQNFWLGTAGGGLNLYDDKKNQFIKFRHQTGQINSLSNDTVNYIFQDKAGSLWIATQNGLNLFNTITKTFNLYQYAPGGAQGNNLVAIAQDTAGNLWLGSKDNGVLLFNLKAKTFKQIKHDDRDPLSLGSDVVKSILGDKAGHIWITCINGGLNRYNSVNKNFSKYRDDPGNTASLSQTSASAIFEDKQGNLWVGTHRGGVNLYAPQAAKFNLYRQKQDPQSISYNDVKTLCQDKNGNIWVGTDGGGLNLFDRKKNTFRHYQFNPNLPGTISSNAVMDILQDRDQNIWVGTWSGGLNLFNPQSGTFTAFRNNPKNKTSISSNFIQKIFQDSKGNLWVGTYFGGLNLLDAKTHQFKHITQDADGLTHLSGNNVLAIGEDAEGHVWFGTDDAGLNCYNLNTKKFSHYFNQGDVPSDIRVIFTDHKKRLWIGQLGLYLFNTKTNSFELYTKKGGLATEFIKGIIEDKHGRLWISTSNGLTQLDPETASVKKYGIRDGLQGLEYETNAYLKTSDGEFFFGGTRGLTTFYPDQIKSNKFVPPVYLTGFQIFNKSIVAGGPHSPLKTEISVAKEINLSYSQSSISFDYAALNYVISENNSYAYKLDGFDTGWVQAGHLKRASYTNLDPGNYTFRVKASNNDGIWNETGTAILVTITPPFWDTWWFKIATAMVILGAAYAFYRSRINSVKKQKKYSENR